MGREDEKVNERRTDQCKRSVKEEGKKGCCWGKRGIRREVVVEVHAQWGAREGRKGRREGKKRSQEKAKKGCGV